MKSHLGTVMRAEQRDAVPNKNRVAVGFDKTLSLLTGP